MEQDKTDKISYAPFILLDSGEYGSLILSDQHMIEKFHVFEERADEGWNGNGYDWNSIAQVIVAEQLPDLQDELDFDPEAGMFSAQGSRSALERFGKAMSSAFHNDEVLRDLLSRAELD
ncbi:Imm51 family immunity protein [Methylomonas montana]|uniref:Imm51 family immunity protein n=1 Tax=Methylomonas montana TaxID=3058963 RepID=UPI0026592F75|nr:Imm51 family immunity protein [Methylomonas montana]WKJ89204.1 Imm51 family immunity protein [Methylomonas montana]